MKRPALLLIVLGSCGLLVQSGVPAEAAIAFRSPAASTSLNGSAASITISKPTNTVQNDVMVAGIAVRLQTVTITAPAGWTLQRRQNNAVSTDSGLAIYYKVAGAAEPASYTWCLTTALPPACTGGTGTASTGSAGGILSFSGVDTASVIVAELAASTAAAATSFIAPSVNTGTVTNTYVLTHFSLPSAEAWVRPTGTTLGYDAASLDNTPPQVPGVDILAAYILRAASGATPTYTATNGAASGADAGNMDTLALRPLVCAAVANPTYVSAQAQSTQATIHWSSPTNANVVVLEKPTTAFAGEVPVNGTIYTVGNTIGAATVRYVGSASEFTRTGLTNNTTYHYKVFPRTTSQSCYGPGTSSVTARPASAANAAWSYMLAGGSALKPPTAGDDGIFFSSNSGQIISLDPATGLHNWAPVATTSATQGWLVPANLSAGGSRVFTGDQGGKVYSVDSAAGGTPLWQPATGATAIQAGPAVQFRTWADAAFTTALPGTSTIGFAAPASSSGGAVASLTYALTVPAGTDRFLIVSVQLGSNCATVSPTVTGVTYATVALTRITSILGTPCGMATTRSEQWLLIAPTVGTANVVVTLSSTAAASVHSGAMAFTGVDQTTPVRGFNSARGVGLSSTVTLASAVGDLVVNTVGQGNSITGPGGGETQRFLRNVNASNTLNNSAGSTEPGAASVTSTWTFPNSDEWQTISSSLQPSASDYDLVFVATKNGAATTNNKVYALRSDTGAVVWTFNDGTAGNNWSVGEINATPYVDYERNRLYVTSLSTAGTGGSVWIVNTLTGRLVGTPATCPNANTACVNLGNIDTAPNVSFDNDTLWVGNKVGAVYAITLSQVPGASMMKWTAPLSLGATNQIKGLIWQDWDTAGRLYMVVANTTPANNTVRCFLDPGIGGTPNAATACSGWAAATVTINGAQAGLPLDQFYVTSWDGTTARIQQLDYAAGTPGTPFVIGDGLRQPGDLSTDLGSELFVGTTEGKIFKISLPIPP